MEIIKPEEKYLQSYYEACLETWGHVHDNYIIHNPKEFDDWKNHIFQDYKNYAIGKNLPDGFVPSETYWIIENEEYIGTINVRLRLNEHLAKYGGHAGILIRLSKRKMGFGTKGIGFAIKRAKELNINPLLLTCEDSNNASKKLLELFNPNRCEKDTVFYKGCDTPIMRYYYDFLH